jgi:hypothetical protein
VPTARSGHPVPTARAPRTAAKPVLPVIVRSVLRPASAAGTTAPPVMTVAHVQSARHVTSVLVTTAAHVQSAPVMTAHLAPSVATTAPPVKSVGPGMTVEPVSHERRVSHAKSVALLPHLPAGSEGLPLSYAGSIS